MGVGILAAWDLIEAVGARALTLDEVLWAAGARKRRGCRLIPSTLTDADRQRVIALGQQCQRWQAAQQAAGGAR
jgi:hypothetical protein